MRSLIKIPLFLIFLCMGVFGFDFPQPNPYSAFRNSNLFSGMEKVKAELISDKYIKSGNDIYKINAVYYFFIDSFNKHEGFYFNGYFYFVDSPLKKAYCFWADTSLSSYTRNCYVSHPPPAVEVEYRNSVEFTVAKIATCQADENFNTDTQQCQKCPDGQSWNPATNSCFNDCTDLNKNKYGFTDGSCADCSGEKESFDVKKCYCNFIGSTPRLQDVEIIQGDFRFTTCADGSEFWYKIPGTPDVDNNKTKPDLKNPSPGDNGTKPGDQNNPNQGGGNHGGNQGNNPKPNPNPGNNTNPNPDPKPNPKPGNGNTTNTNNDGNNNDVGVNKDAGVKFNKDDFNDEDLRKERDGLYDGIKKHINDNLSKFDGIRDSIDQFVKNVQGKGFEKVQANIKTTCPIKKQILLPNGKSQEVVVDYCEIVSPASEISYYAFYAGFAIGGFLLFLKLLIFSI